MKGDPIYGYAGKILRVNLSNGRTTIESTLPYAKDWLGSSGIAIRFLYDELRDWVTPYDPANKLIFGAGVLEGTIAPGAAKMTVSTLGPMTGGWASGASDSYMGGELKFAGFDLIIVEGKSYRPAYLLINDDHVEIRDASKLWGKTTWETLDTLRVKLKNPGLHILSIGPAGENLVRGASIIQDRGRAFGRCGSGAVMGSKNLKAIVVKGSGSIKIADAKRLFELTRSIRKRFRAAKTFLEVQKYGTLRLVSVKQAACGMNYKNFQETRLPDDLCEAIDPRKTIDRYQVTRLSFPACPIGCGRVLNFVDGPYSGLITNAPQFEAVSTLQGRLAISEPQFMFKANAYCNQMGLDIDLLGGAVGWAFECYQRGILSKEDTDGLELEWGNPSVVLELARKICYREGFGNILAEGSAKAADLIGRSSSYYAMNIKGQDLYEPCRGANGWTLGVTTSTRGGGHTTGAPWCELPRGQDPRKLFEVFGVESAEKLMEYEGRAKMVVTMEAIHRISNCLGICHFTTVASSVDFTSPSEIAELYSAATGFEKSYDELQVVAERQLNLEKAFNLRHTNFKKIDDMPTLRDLTEPIPTGNLSGWRIDVKKFEKMLDEYYELHHWERETGYPTRKSLESLGLKNVADDLVRMGKLYEQ